MKNARKWNAAQIVLWLYVVFLAIALGAGLYEARITVPTWLVALGDGSYRWDAATARQMNVGMRFWGFVSTGPLTLLTLISLFVAYRYKGSARRWWLGAAGVEVIERAMTFGFFIPTMMGLMQADASTDGVIQTAQRWVQLNILREFLNACALVFALRAFAAVHVDSAQR